MRIKIVTLFWRQNLKFEQLFRLPRGNFISDVFIGVSQVPLLVGFIGCIAIGVSGLLDLLVILVFNCHVY